MRILPKKPFTWVLLGFIVYAYITHNQDNPKTEKEIPLPENPLITAKPSNNDKAIMDKPINFVLNEMGKTDAGQAVFKALAEQSIKDKYGNKDIYAAQAQEQNKLLKVDKLIGTGPFAQCGSEVTINYQYLTDHNVKIDSNNDEPITLTIGNKKALKGLENGIVGMRKGGKRKIAAPSHLAYGDKFFENNLMERDIPIIIEVDLIDVKNGIDSDSIITIENLTEGAGSSELLCGDSVNIAYKTQTNHTGIASFKLGDGDAPSGLEKGMLGMKTGGTRRITIPQDQLQARNDSILYKQLQIPQQGSFVIEVTLNEKQ